jgi:RES domain
VTDQPGEHPEPHPDLADRSPLLYSLDEGTVLSRLHDKDFGPIYFGVRSSYRFDSPDGRFGVLYAGLDEHCAFIETFGQSTGIRVVSQKALAQRHLSYLALRQPLQLIDLANSGGLARIGTDSRLFSGSHSIAQRWSASLRAHPTNPAGILYPARHDTARRACGLYDLPDSAFSVNTVGSLIDPPHRKLLAGILNTYDFGLIP